MVLQILVIFCVEVVAGSRLAIPLLLLNDSFVADNMVISMSLVLLKQIFQRLYEHSTSHLHVLVHLTILEAIRDVCKRVGKELTSWVSLCLFPRFLVLVVLIPHLVTFSGTLIFILFRFTFLMA